MRIIVRSCSGRRPAPAAAPAKPLIKTIQDVDSVVLGRGQLDRTQGATEPYWPTGDRGYIDLTLTSPQPSIGKTNPISTINLSLSLRSIATLLATQKTLSVIGISLTQTELAIVKQIVANSENIDLSVNIGATAKQAPIGNLGITLSQVELQLISKLLSLTPLDLVFSQQEITVASQTSLGNLGLTFSLENIVPVITEPGNINLSNINLNLSVVQVIVAMQTQLSNIGITLSLEELTAQLTSEDEIALSYIDLLLSLETLSVSTIATIIVDNLDLTVQNPSVGTGVTLSYNDLTLALQNLSITSETTITYTDLGLSIQNPSIGSETIISYNDLTLSAIIPTVGITAATQTEITTLGIVFSIPNAMTLPITFSMTEVTAVVGVASTVGDIGAFWTTGKDIGAFQTRTPA